MPIKFHNEHRPSLIAVVKDSSLAEILDEYAARVGVVDAKVQIHDQPLDNATAIVNGGADIVVIQTERNDTEALDALEDLCKYISRDGAFIVIIDDPTTEIVRRLFRAGVTDVLPAPADKKELIAAIETAREKASILTPLKSPTSNDGKIITVLKTVGGVGGTTVSSNLARSLKEETGGEVAIIDLDMQFGTLALALDLKPRMNVTDAIRAGDRLDATLLKSVMTRHKSGLDILAAPPNLTPLDVITESFVRSMSDDLKTSYDYVIVEMSSAWSHWTYAMLEASSVVAVVIEPSVRSADGARRIAQGFDDLTLKNLPLFVVANKVTKSAETKERLKQIGVALGKQPDAFIRLDEKTATDSADVGRLLKDLSAKSGIADDFDRLAQKIVTHISPDRDDGKLAAPMKAKSRGRRFPFLGE